MASDLEVRFLRAAELVNEQSANVLVENCSGACQASDALYLVLGRGRLLPPLERPRGMAQVQTFPFRIVKVQMAGDDHAAASCHLSHRQTPCHPLTMDCCAWYADEPLKIGSFPSSDLFC